MRFVKAHTTRTITPGNDFHPSRVKMTSNPRHVFPEGTEVLVEVSEFKGSPFRLHFPQHGCYPGLTVVTLQPNEVARFVRSDRDESGRPVAATDLTLYVAYRAQGERAERRNTYHGD